MENQNGKGAAIASLVLGIIGLVIDIFFGILIGPVGLVLGIIGLILASKAKNDGFTGGLRTAGFVLSLLSLIFGAISFVACIACAGALSAVGYSYY